MCAIADQEDVARAVFSPKMVFRGKILPAAFELRPQMAEEYLSVMRMSFKSWKKDILSIPQRKNRQLYGYAEMNVGEIRTIRKDHVKYDVVPCDNITTPSHAGIFITVNNEKLVGGRPLLSIQDKTAQDFMLLSIRQELVKIAQKRLRVELLKQ
ncbi:MAG: hypothetical protein IJQ76_11400 [Prevotella sp.]|nr:hypothetical protein [Prevotella sp.]